MIYIHNIKETSHIIAYYILHMMWSSLKVTYNSQWMQLKSIERWWQQEWKAKSTDTLAIPSKKKTQNYDRLNAINERNNNKQLNREIILYNIIRYIILNWFQNTNLMQSTVNNLYVRENNLLKKQCVDIGYVSTEFNKFKIINSWYAYITNINIVFCIIRLI